MKKLMLFAMMAALVALLAIGCSNDDKSMAPVATSNLSSALLLPHGAVIENATLHLYVIQENMQTINIHRVTAAWDEATITWNNFSGAYDGTVWSSFNADAWGWLTVDVTALVQAWVDGDFDNYGLLLDQTDMNYPRAVYFAWENGTNYPYLEVTYNAGMGSTTETTDPVQDAYIWEVNPNDNFGLREYLYTGWEAPNDLEKQALIQFEIDVYDIPQDGCTRTIGYWKTHAGFGPQDDDVTPLLPVYLGDMGGAKSLFIDNAAAAVDVFKMKAYGGAKNGIAKLYAQLLGARLNMLSGASTMDVADAMSEADAFLANHDWMDWSSLSPMDQQMVLAWKDMLDDFNNGYIGPGHCE
ncbi:MAG TPA: DNRLRE domain-containing protein [candidate division Zixibacteria bacterium]|nr:DNRLRE domain-containing protein [candidate division Zixibacteria bacterium]